MGTWLGGLKLIDEDHDLGVGVGKARPCRGKGVFFPVRFAYSCIFTLYFHFGRKIPAARCRQPLFTAIYMVTFLCSVSTSSPRYVTRALTNLPLVSLLCLRL